MRETIINARRVYKYGKEYRKHLIGLIVACLSGVVIGILVPLLSAKQIVYLTSSELKQAIYISVIILIIKCYMFFSKYFFWSRNAHRFIKGTTKNLQVAMRK